MSRNVVDLLRDMEPLERFLTMIFVLYLVGMAIGYLVGGFYEEDPDSCLVCVRKCEPFVVSSCHLESNGVSCACDVEKRAE